MFLKAKAILHARLGVGGSRSLITALAKFPHRQRRAAIHVRVYCLRLAVTAFEATFFRRLIRDPCRASGVCL